MKNEGVKFRYSIYATSVFIVIIWSVKMLEYTLGYDFSELGILPRTLKGSIGIITAPLIHGDIYHLLSNTFPIIFLGMGITYFYTKIAPKVILLIYIMTGFWVWLAARDAYHIGASGLVYGMLTFLLFSGFFRRDTKTLAISFIVLFLYGGTFATGLLPTDEAISWESHLMGAIAGVFCAIYFKNFKLYKEENISQEVPDAQPPTYRYVYKQSVDSATRSPETYTINISPKKDNLSNTSAEE